MKARLLPRAPFFQGVMSAADGRLHAANSSERGGRRCNSCHPDHFGWLAEQQCPGPENRVSLRAAWLRFLHHPPFPKRRVAQKQSARLISGRPRSVTAPDDHLTIRKPKSENRKDSHENCQGTQIEEPTGRRHRPVEGTPREAEFPFHQTEVPRWLACS